MTRINNIQCDNIGTIYVTAIKTYFYINYGQSVFVKYASNNFATSKLYLVLIKEILQHLDVWIFNSMLT